MSSILKALQKLEQEKAGRVTREPDIHTGITRRSRSHSARPKWIIPASMLAVAVISITITYLLMKGENLNPATTENIIPTVTKAQEIPAARQTAVSPEGIPPITVNNPTLPAKNNGITQPPGSQSPVGRNQAIKTRLPLVSPAVSPSSETGDSTFASKEQADQSKVDTSVARKTDRALPAITVNGIAWQKDSASRIAVVNGMPVSEGGTVQGTKVEEIFPDRIRFSHNGKQFEVPFGKGEHQ